MIQTLLQKIAQRMAMNAFSNVLSGRRLKWYRNPIQWGWEKLSKLLWYGLILFAFVRNIFYDLIVPLLIVCMFITLHRMNDKLDALDAAVNSETETAIVLEWVRGKIEEIEDRNDN